MTRCLAHRGPDGEGFHVDGPLGLGHRRLAIVDPSPTGAQPMATADGPLRGSATTASSTTTALPAALERSGHRFRGTLGHRDAAPPPGEHGAGRCSPRWRPSSASPSGTPGRARLIAGPRPAGREAGLLPRRRPADRSSPARSRRCSSTRRAARASTRRRSTSTSTSTRRSSSGRSSATSGRCGRASTWRSDGDRGARAALLEPATGSSRARTAPEEQVADAAGAARRVVGEQLMSDVPVGAFFSGGIDSSSGGGLRRAGPGSRRAASASTSRTRGSSTSGPTRRRRPRRSASSSS